MCEISSYPRTSTINNIIGNSFNNSSSELSKAPHAGEDSPEHIYLGNVTTIEIGEPGENPNNFLHGLIGINSQESTALIQNNNFTNIGNNTFQNLRTINPPPVYINPFGGIYSKKSSISIGSTTATLGTGLSKNTFTDCQLGVYANNDVLVDISENEFTLIGQAIYVSNSKNGNSRTLNIIGNTIDKYSVGIELNDVYLLASTNISDNLLNFNLGYDPSNYGYTGILIRNYSQGGGFYTLHNNWIENTRFGIHLNNISAAIKCIICPPDKEYFGLTVSNNHVKEVISTSDLSIDNDHIGIWLEDVRGGNLLVNNVFWTENPSGLGSETMQGIRLQKSLDCRLMQNVMTNMESGLMVFGDNSKTNLFCNTFENNYVATFFSDNNSGSNNILTDQGEAVFNPTYDPSLSYSWKNNWITTINSKVGGTPGTNFNWLYKNSGSYDYYPGSFSLYFTTRSCNNEISDCNPILSLDEIKRDKEFGKVAYDSIPNNPDSLNLMYYNKEVFYKLAKEDSAYYNLNVSSDSAYITKFNEIKESNIGKFEEIKALILKDELDSAKLLANTVVDTTTIESNNKLVASIFLDYYSKDSIPDSTTIDLLIDIAHQHPFEGGDGVYSARAMLHLDIIDILPPMRIRGVSSTEHSIDRNGALFPNPATNSVTFVYPEFDPKYRHAIHLVDIVGKTISIYEMHTKSLEFSVLSLNPGIYYLKLDISDDTSKTFKLVIER